jgi:predicted transcriptional regulator of viral defense system
VNNDPFFKYLVACLIVAHVEHRKKINKVAQCCARLTKQGVLRRVGRGKYEFVGNKS